MSLDKDVKQIKDYILYLIEQSKKHPTTDMILGGIRQSTIINFNYKVVDNPLNITTVTVCKIAKRLDKLECNTESYHKEFKEIIKHFIKTYILIDDINNLTKFDLNYTTLHKMKDYSLKTPYRLTTLEKYARILKEKEGNDELYVKY